MKGNRYSEDEIILCIYIARFGRGFINEDQICSLFDRRPAGSVSMKVQNIARMLNEEGYRYSQEVSPWGGGHRTDWATVQSYADQSEPDLQSLVKKIFARGANKSTTPRLHCPICGADLHLHLEAVHQRQRTAETPRQDTPALQPVTARRPADSPTKPSASSPPDRRIPLKQRRRRPRMGDNDYLQLGENHEP